MYDIWKWNFYFNINNFTSSAEAIWCLKGKVEMKYSLASSLRKKILTARFRKTENNLQLILK